MLPWPAGLLNLWDTEDTQEASLLIESFAESWTPGSSKTPTEVNESFPRGKVCRASLSIT